MIEFMAHHDSLTELANRVLLNERLEQALARIDGEKRVAVHHLDLDQFKAVNDTFGHPAGDRLLKIVAERLAGWFGNPTQLHAREAMNSSSCRPPSRTPLRRRRWRSASSSY